MMALTQSFVLVVHVMVRYGRWEMGTATCCTVASLNAVLAVCLSPLRFFETRACA